VGLALSDSLSLNDEERVFQAQPRFSIMYLLFLKRQIGFIELQRLLGLTPGNLDHHIKKLEEANLVHSRRVISWRPLVTIEMTIHGSEIFRGFVLKLKTLLKEIPGKLLQEPEI
jgi:DNA-binding MarR family transcriptional regulator